MEKTVNIKVTSKDQTENEEIKLEFDSFEIAVLRKFLENCDRLQSAQIFQNRFPFIKNIKWTNEEGMTFDISDFEYSHVCEFLHLVRPVFLSKEPACFEKVQAIFRNKSKKTLLAKHLKYLRQTYKDGDYKKRFQISVSNVPLFDEETLQLWFNGIEYHQDPEKETKIKKIEKILTEKALQGILVSQLSGRIRTTFMLAELVKLVTSNTEANENSNS
jgi:hypothetical protein